MAVRKPETFQPPKGSQDPPVPATPDDSLSNLSIIEGIGQFITDAGTPEQPQESGLDKFLAALQGGSQPQGGTPQEAPQGALTSKELANPFIQQMIAEGMTPEGIASLRAPKLFSDQADQSIPLNILQRALKDHRSLQQEESSTAGSFSTQEDALAAIAQGGATGQAIPVIREDGSWSIKQLSPAELRANEERAPRDMQELIIQQLTEGNFEAALAFDAVAKRPSSMEALQVAMDWVSSPADVFTLSAIASSALDRGPSTLGEVNPLPRSPLLQQIFDKAMGQALGLTDSFGFPEQQKAAPQPTSPQPQAAPTTGPITQPTGPIAPTPQTGGVGLVGQQEIVKPAQQVGSGLFDPNQQFTGPGGSGVDPSRLGQLSPPFQATQPVGGSATADPFGSFSGGRFFSGDAPRSVTLPGQPTGQEPQTLIPPVQPQPGITDFAPPQGVAPIVPPGVPQGSIQFGGKDLPIPIGLQSLFEGGTGGVVEKRRSLLAEAGLPILSAQAQRRLLPAELEAFKAIAQTAGIPLPQINKELGATRPGGSRRRKISSAGV